MAQKVTIKTIKKDKVLSEKIRIFLRKRGLELAGGSFDADGTLWLTVENFGSMTYSSRLGQDLKELLNLQRIVLDGIVY